MEFDVVEGEKVTTALVNSVSFVTWSNVQIFVIRIHPVNFNSGNCIFLKKQKTKTVHREQRRQM